MKKYFIKIREWFVIWFDALTDRERKLLSLFLICLSVLVIIGLIFVSTQKISSKNARLAKSQQQLMKIKSLEGDYKKAKLETDKFKFKIRSNRISLISLLDGITKRYGLTVTDFNETQRPVGKTGVVEISVKFSLSKLSLDKVTALIEDIETTSQGRDLVKVVRVKINKRFDEPELLDLQMTVSTWKTA